MTKDSHLHPEIEDLKNICSLIDNDESSGKSIVKVTLDGELYAKIKHAADSEHKSITEWLGGIIQQAVK